MEQASDVPNWQSSDLASLPRDILSKIFQLLDFEQIFIMRLICHAMRNFISKFEQLTIRSANRRSLEANITAFTSANELELTFSQVKILGQRSP